MAQLPTPPLSTILFDNGKISTQEKNKKKILYICAYYYYYYYYLDHEIYASIKNTKHYAQI